MADQIQVQTVFTVLDKASGPIQAAAKAADNLKKSADNAKTSLSGMGQLPLPFAGPSTKQGAAGSEQAQFRRDREEAALQRARVRHVRLTMDRERLAAGVTEAAAKAIGHESAGFAGRLSGTAMALQEVGFQMTEMGGKAGAFGQALTTLAGKAIAVVGALGVGVEVGHALDNWLGLSDKLAGIDPKKMAAANEAYAKSLGYRNLAEFSAAREVGAQLETNKRLNVAIEQHIASLTAVPLATNKQAVEEFNRNFMGVARDISIKTGVPLEQVSQQLMQASEQSLATITLRANHEANLASAVEREAKLVSALPTDAARNQVLKHNEILSQHVKAIMRATGATNAEADTIFAALKARVQERSSIDNVTAAISAREKTDALISSAVKEQANKLRTLPVNSTADQMIAFNESLLTTARLIHKNLGEQAAPEMLDTIFQKLKDQTMSKQKTTYDFRNSRFDIKQNFAEGFDPDRIAVAFADNLSRVTENRLQSTQVPAGGVR